MSALLSTLLGALLSKQWLKEGEGEECFQLSLQETTSKWGKNIKNIKKQALGLDRRPRVRDGGAFISMKLLIQRRHRKSFSLPH